ncbi:SDR family NAD(P)-dependent oxidoreductase [Spirillospora sp. CA-142024]|uniref:SDR family NAD(P)-dependent oxidoreductase n=1 Tax=Spirillospora sp. CA-142024 TaxID=3240036 RepID=UPI003D8FBE4D
MAVLMQRETPERACLVGKVVLVIGATSGIGAAVARRVAAEGAAVVAAGRRTELGEHLVTEVRAGGGEALFVTCDATVEDDVAAADAVSDRELYLPTEWAGVTGDETYGQNPTFRAWLPTGRSRSFPPPATTTCSPDHSSIARRAPATRTSSRNGVAAGAAQR